MKKLSILGILALGLVLLPGCDKKATNSADISAIYAKNHSVTCNLTFDDEGFGAINAKLYIKDGSIREEASTIYDNEEYTDVSLIKDGMFYTWGSSYGENIGVQSEYDISIDEYLAEISEDQSGVKMSCKKGAKSNLFDVPTNISFMTLEEYYTQLYNDYAQESELQLDTTDDVDENIDTTDSETEQENVPENEESENADNE